MDNKAPQITLVIILLAILALAALSFRQAPLLQNLENKIYDLEISFFQKDKKQPPSIVLIGIDEKSLQEQGPWPRSRKLITSIIQLLEESSPTVIGLYLPLLAEEHNDGLSEIQDLEQRLKLHPLAKSAGDFRNWIEQNLAQMIKRLDHDTALAESLAASGRIILPFKVYATDPPQSEKEKHPFRPNQYLSTKKPVQDYRDISTAHKIDVPLKAFREAALGLGHDHFKSFHGPMGYRSHPVFISHSGGLLPSFPLALLIHSNKLTPGQIVVEENRFQIQDLSLPLSRGELLFRFNAGPKSFVSVSWTDLLSSPQKYTLKDKIVLVGLNTSQALIVDSPLGPISEVELAAHILSSLLNRQVISRPSWLKYLEIFLILGFGCFSLLFYPRYGHRGRFIWAIGLMLLVLISGFILMNLVDIWFKTGTIALSILAVFLIYCLLNSILGEGFSKESIETNRLLGLSFQSQGLLDLAFDKFRKIPLNDETKDLLYNLGLEFEKKRLINKALSVYEYIYRTGNFRDLKDRIPKLRAADKSSTLGSHSLSKEGGLLTDSSVHKRSRVGRYEILEELGKGSMGLVYKALDPKINRVVAIKTIRFSDEFDEDVINEIKERFFREAEIAGRLSHPSIVTIHDVGDDQDLTYMAMEYLEGNDLEKYIDKGHLLTLRQVLDVVSQIAEALDFAHQSEVIHRDIKPANIMILSNGRVKVTDFGIAKAISSSRTRTGVILGTPNYMSPEQIMGQVIGPRSDIFSLGVLFYQLLTGELPFHGENLSSLLYQITQVKHPSVKEKNPKVPRACEQIIDKAMAKNPNSRFSRASEMARVIKLLVSKMDAIKRDKQDSG